MKRNVHRIEMASAFIVNSCIALVVAFYEYARRRAVLEFESMHVLFEIKMFLGYTLMRSHFFANAIKTKHL